MDLYGYPSIIFHSFWVPLDSTETILCACVRSYPPCVIHGLMGFALSLLFALSFQSSNCQTILPDHAHEMLPVDPGRHMLSIIHACHASCHLNVISTHVECRPVAKDQEVFAAIARSRGLSVGNWFIAVMAWGPSGYMINPRDSNLNSLRLWRHGGYNMIQNIHSGTVRLGKSRML